jgi:uncharacterized Fe-S cluster protein YjdI
MSKHYTKGNLTVVWTPDLCIHSTVCWKGLKDVFDPRKKPWINMEGADVERIKAQVMKCPSGALSFVEHKEETTAENTVVEETISVEAMKNGPLMVYGNLSVKDSKGNMVTKSNVTAFCRCGGSSNKPFCDGTHMKIGFKD